MVSWNERGASQVAGIKGQSFFGTRLKCQQGFSPLLAGAEKPFPVQLEWQLTVLYYTILQHNHYLTFHKCIVFKSVNQKCHTTVSCLRGSHCTTVTLHFILGSHLVHIDCSPFSWFGCLLCTVALVGGTHLGSGLLECLITTQSPPVLLSPNVCACCCKLHC